MARNLPKVGAMGYRRSRPDMLLEVRNRSHRGELVTVNRYGTIHFLDPTDFIEISSVKKTVTDRDTHLVDLASRIRRVS